MCGQDATLGQHRDGQDTRNNPNFIANFMYIPI